MMMRAGTLFGILVPTFSGSRWRCHMDAIVYWAMYHKRRGPVPSPSGDATGCNTSSAPAEDDSSRKKPRLGWGEGLAMYEKKKVEGPDESAPKEVSITGTAAEDAMDDGASNLETLHSNHVNVMEKSPKLKGISECASPATPSSVACSSSPGTWIRSAKVVQIILMLCLQKWRRRLAWLILSRSWVINAQ